MRALFAILLSFILLTSIASAEMMLTASPLGQGSWGFLGSALQDTDWGNNSGLTLTTLGGYVGYGILDNLDGYIQIGLGTAGGTLPVGLSSASGTAYGGVVKYTVLDEAPVSVAVAGGAKAIKTEMKAVAPGGTTTMNNTQILIGANVSKMMAPFVPYGGAVYRSTSGDSEGTQIDITVGSVIAFMANAGVYVEYTLQSITPKGGSNYSSGQIGVGVGATI
jgi:hypothetical protein